jgi:hypothetical protein
MRSCNLTEETRERGRNGNQNPEQRGEDESSDGDGLQRDAA